MADKKSKRPVRRENKKSTLTVRAFLSAGLVIFALAAANLSFMSYARDALSGALNGSIAYETVKSIGLGGLEGIKELADSAAAAFGKDEENETEKKPESTDNTEEEQPAVIKIVPPESFLPEQEK